jgi:hypothetical protein
VAKTTLAFALRTRDNTPPKKALGPRRDPRKQRSRPFAVRSARTAKRVEYFHYTRSFFPPPQPLPRKKPPPGHAAPIVKTTENSRVNEKRNHNFYPSFFLPAIFPTTIGKNEKTEKNKTRPLSAPN